MNHFSLGSGAKKRKVELTNSNGHEIVIIREMSSGFAYLNGDSSTHGVQAP